MTEPPASGVDALAGARPALSITVLNYNYAHYLPVCLDSILSQSFADFEVLLINDCSTDDSSAVIARYRNDPRIRLIDHEENQGFVRSLIEGCAQSRGEFIAVISADDYVVDPQAFETQVAMLRAAPGAVMCATGYVTDDGSGGPFPESWLVPGGGVLPGPDALHIFLTKTIPLHSGTVVRRTSFDALGGYDSTNRWGLDTQLFMGLCAFGDVAFASALGYAYRRHASNMSRDPDTLAASIEEYFGNLERTWAVFADQGQPQTARLLRAAKQHILTAYSVDALFAGHTRLSVRFYLACLRLEPALTLFSRGTVVYLLRLLLGRRLYRRLRPSAE